MQKLRPLKTTRQAILCWYNTSYCRAQGSPLYFLTSSIQCEALVCFEKRFIACWDTWQEYVHVCTETLIKADEHLGNREIDNTCHEVWIEAWM